MASLARLEDEGTGRKNPAKNENAVNASGASDIERLQHLKDMFTGISERAGTTRYNPAIWQRDRGSILSLFRRQAGEREEARINDFEVMLKMGNVDEAVKVLKDSIELYSGRQFIADGILFVRSIRDMLPQSEEFASAPREKKDALVLALAKLAEHVAKSVEAYKLRPEGRLLPVLRELKLPDAERMRLIAQEAYINLGHWEDAEKVITEGCERYEHSGNLQESKRLSDLAKDSVEKIMKDTKGDSTNYRAGLYL